MSNLNLSQAKGGFLPQFDGSKEIVSDNGLPVKGTAILVFQGLTMRTVTTSNVDNDGLATPVEVSFPVAVFGCLSDQGTFRNIPSAVNRKTLELLFTTLGLELPLIESASPLAAIAKKAKSLKAYATKKTLDLAKTEELLEPLRGLTYTGVMERKLNQRTGRPYFMLHIASLSPVADDKNKQIRLQKPEETTPDAVELDILEEDLGSDDIAA